MSVDKRTVATDALETLGTIITPNEKRDAIHLAVENVVCGVDALHAGEDVGFLPNGSVGGISNEDVHDLVGIVDPFLEEAVRLGDRFWLVVYPRQITSLRHVWTHPAFPECELDDSTPVPTVKLKTKIQLAEAWIEDFASSIPLDYDTLLEGADDWVKSGGYDFLCFGGLLDGEYIPDEFWGHYCTVRGVSVPESKRGSFFACNC